MTASGDFGNSRSQYWIGFSLYDSLCSPSTEAGLSREGCSYEKS